MFALFPNTSSAATDPAYLDAIQKTAGMASNPEAAKLAKEHGLQILNVTWEDTGRYKGSAVGPNISDMTIQVASRQGEQVIRFPNFEDKSADLDPATSLCWWVISGANRSRESRCTIFLRIPPPT